MTRWVPRESRSKSALSTSVRGSLLEIAHGVVTAGYGGAVPSLSGLLGCGVVHIGETMTGSKVRTGRDWLAQVWRKGSSGYLLSWPSYRKTSHSMAQVSHS